MKKLVSIFRIPELRTKIFFTLAMLAVYRLGFWVYLPIIDQKGVDNYVREQFGDWAAVVNNLGMFAGVSLSQMCVFGLGIMPYISASIIFQLLASVVPSLEKLQKEGEVGRKKINEYTRYATVFLCLIQNTMFITTLASAAGRDYEIIPAEYNTFFYKFVCVIAMTAGTVFLMWIGEQIDEYGIGNGISLIIMAGIIGRLPDALRSLNFQGGFGQQDGGRLGLDGLLIMIALFLAVIVVVILITQGQRRIPIQSARHVRGRRVFGGNKLYLPLKINQAGVMPIIFASSLLLIPTAFLTYVTANGDKGGVLGTLQRSFSNHGFVYIAFYVGLIYFFCYFWTAITFNPKDTSNNLKDYGSFIPGYRPGRRTADYLEKVMLRITYVGAAFLAAVAIIPSIVGSRMGVNGQVASFFGGTSLLIMISVALDLIQKIDSYLIMRNYESLVPSNRRS